MSTLLELLTTIEQATSAAARTLEHAVDQAAPSRETWGQAAAVESAAARLTRIAYAIRCRASHAS